MNNLVFSEKARRLTVIICAGIILVILASFVVFSFLDCSNLAELFIYRWMTKEEVVIGTIFLIVGAMAVGLLAVRGWSLPLTLLILLWILVSVVFNLSNPRVKSTDDRRVADIKVLQVALEFYREVNFKYPLLLSELVPTHTNVIPNDPSGEEYTYVVSEDQNDYVLRAFLGGPSKLPSCKFSANPPAVLTNDVDEIVFGVQCDDPAYCVMP